jgi:pimeloyl-ACP methyl ester carboxylesterase
LKQSIVLIHGALGTGSQLESLASLLSDEFNCYLIELEGHGSTPLGGESYSFARFGEQIEGLVQREDIAPAILFGYSMGGYAALTVAVDAPSVVRYVITLGTKMAWSAEAAAKEASRLDPVKIREKVPAFAYDLEWRHGNQWERVLANTAKLMTELGQRPLLDDGVLARIAAPVRFMVGDRDSVVTIDETTAAAASVPKGECVILPDTPHPFEQVNVELVASLIRSPSLADL